MGATFGSWCSWARENEGAKAIGAWPLTREWKEATRDAPIHRDSLWFTCQTLPCQ